jgi:hypothetical protein
MSNAERAEPTSADASVRLAYRSRDELYVRPGRYTGESDATPPPTFPANPLSEEQHKALVLRFLSYAKGFSAVPRLTRDQLHDRD